MQYFGSRDARKRLGFGSGREMEETELEEGEACYYQEDDGTSTDPDAELSSLSYVGEKLQDVLGHFQKDFEGLVSAENLGAKYGMYGSFLPTCQRSPSILSHNRTAPKLLTRTAMKSPNNFTLEGVRQNPLLPSNASQPVRNPPPSTNVQPGTVEPLLDNHAKRETCASVAHDSVNKSVGGTDQKKLKVLFKMGSDNVSVRKNEAIYDGLGLNISPSSSTEDSADDSGGLSPAFGDPPDESPLTILKIMTSFPVPGDSFLSPLPQSLLYLTEKEKPLKKDDKSRIACNSGQKIQLNETPSIKELKFWDKKVKTAEKNGRSIEKKYACDKSVGSDSSDLVKREIDSETLMSGALVSNVLNLPLLSCLEDNKEKSERHIDGDLRRCDNSLPDHSKDAFVGKSKDRSLPLNLVKDEVLDPVVSQDTGWVSKESNELMSLRGKVNSKKRSSENTSDEKKENILKDTSLDPRSNGKVIVEKALDAFDFETDGFEERKDQNSVSVKPQKQKVKQKATTVGQDGLKISEDKRVHKKKLKGNLSKGISPSELPKDCLRDDSSVQLKHEKKSSQARDSLSRNKSHSIKSNKDFNKTSAKECHGDPLEGIKNEPPGQPEMRFKYKVKDLKSETERETDSFAEKSKEKSGGRKVEKPSTSMGYPKFASGTPLNGYGPTSDAPSVPAAPVVIKENWVCCDSCQQWRLLPFGMDPINLPKKWLCSMLNWLPGMNSCDFREDETTKALYALYQNPYPGTENQNNFHGQFEGAVSVVTSADVHVAEQSHELGSHALPGGGKKKHGSKDASNALKQSASAHLRKPVKKNQQVSVKSKSLDDVNQNLLESGLANKNAFKSKPNNNVAEKHHHKQKEKHKLRGCFSDGGDYTEPSGKHSKTKTKRNVDQDGFRISKKIKMEGLHYRSEDWQSGHDAPMTTIPNMGNGSLTKVTCKISQRHGEYATSKESKDDLKDDLLASGKKLKAHVQGSLEGEFKTHSGVVDAGKQAKADFAAKKRKLKEWQLSQDNQVAHLANGPVDCMVSAKEETNESELRKEKKPRAPKTEGKESSLNKSQDRPDKKSRVAKIVLTGSRDSLANGMAEESSGGNAGHLVNNLPQRASSQPSTAATSSSSKVSGKSKTNYPEVRGSPVESVSSSPLRFSKTDMLTNMKRNQLSNEDPANMGSSIIGSPRRSFDGDGGSERLGMNSKEKASSVVQHGSQESQRAGESSIMYTYRGGDQNSGRPEDRMLSKQFDGAHGDPSQSELDNVNVIDSHANHSDPHNTYLSDMCDLDNEPEKPNSHYHDGSIQRKSGKGSSRSRDKHRNTRPDFNKGKDKISDSFSEQGELHATKSSGSCRYEVGSESHDPSPHYVDQMDGKYNLQEKCSTISTKDEMNQSGKKDSNAKWLSNKRRDTQSNFGIHENSDVGSPMVSKQQIDSNSGVGKQGTTCSKDGKSNPQQNLPQTTTHEDERSSNKNDRAEVVPRNGRSQSQLSGDKQARPTQYTPGIPPLHRGSRSDATVGDTSKIDASKVPKKPEVNSGGHHSSKHLMPNGNMGRNNAAPSPARKDGSQAAANAAMKEARDLKHTADRLKSGGPDLESTGLYFQAALKFLHVASLLEPCNAESAKHGETTQSMEVYVYTARLCEDCAHEYERYKEMAAAALAYKCMEVAYMRIIYSKHSISSRDRHELHVALQVVPPGESPSSSASDLDNLNNQATADKSALGKSVNSPQIAGSHVISARNRPNYVRMLNLVQDVTSAMEASRKWQNAFAAATANPDEARRGPEGIQLVGRVLDFNFHDVDGLLRLVRLAMEAISR